MRKRITIIDDDGVIIKTNDYEYRIFDDKKGYLFKNKAYSFKSFKNEPKLSTLVSNYSHIGRLYVLAENTYADTNMISYYHNKKYYPAKISHISEMIGLSEKRCIRFIKDMIKLGVIAEAFIHTKYQVEIQYYLNPLYFLSSKYLSPSLYMLFQKQINQVLPDWVIDRFMNFTDMIE